jgi:hypothetical protein
MPCIGNAPGLSRNCIRFSVEYRLTEIGHVANKIQTLYRFLFYDPGIYENEKGAGNTGRVTEQPTETTGEL